MALAPSSPAAAGDALQIPRTRPFIRCREVREAYDRVAQIGKGQFGAVFKYRCRETGQFVALKKVLMANETEGFPLTALREIKLMKLLTHDNVLKLKEVVHSAATNYNRQLGDIFLVFDYMEHDLGGLLNKGIEFTIPEIKCISKQLFSGLHYLDVNQVLHRDLKVANLLLNNRGILKIADFGLARIRDKKEKDGRYTLPVCTRWYRPPELLLGQRDYTSAIDMWGAGCIVAELFTGSPILQGGVADAKEERDNEIDQFLEICKLCGTPSSSTWPSFDKLPMAGFMTPKQPYDRSLRKVFSKRFKLQCQSAIALCDEILALNPEQRLSANAALDHSFFWEDPMPCKPSEMRTFAMECHDYTTAPHPHRIKMHKTKTSQQQHHGHHRKPSHHSSHHHKPPPAPPSHAPKPDEPRHVPKQKPVVPHPQYIPRKHAQHATSNSTAAKRRSDGMDDGGSPEHKRVKNE